MVTAKKVVTRQTLIRQKKRSNIVNYSSLQTFIRLAAILEHDDTTVRRQRSCTIKLHTVIKPPNRQCELSHLMDIITAKLSMT